MTALYHCLLLQANNAVEPVQETVDVPQEEQPEPAVHASQEAAPPGGQEAPEDDFKVWALSVSKVSSFKGQTDTPHFRKVVGHSIVKCEVPI